MAQLPSTSASPKWGPTAKLIAGLTIVALFAMLLAYFRQILGPLLLVFVVTYLLHPLAVWLSNTTRLSWRFTINLMYLVLVVVLIVLLTLAGFAVFQQIQNLVQMVDSFIKNLPGLVADISSKVYTIGPFQLDFAQYNLSSLIEKLLSYVNPLIGKVTSLVSTFATSAASTFGWTLFVLLISYFFLSDAPRVPGGLLFIDIPGYDADIRRIMFELRRIWNAFLRGQLIMFALVLVCYTVLLTILGVRYSIAIALLAGLARFVPYLGPFTAWTVLGLVSFFQGWNYYNLQPWQFTILSIGLAMFLDQIFDNLVSPRILGRSIGVHPAAVLIAALLATNLIGIIGLVLAAPVLATLTLLGRYIVRKMLDLEPFPEASIETEQPAGINQSLYMRRIRDWVRAVRLKSVKWR
ncbi:MAG: AI-2E family transporter [Omnitrophica WOR_2 bacterium]